MDYGNFKKLALGIILTDVFLVYIFFLFSALISTFVYEGNICMENYVCDKTKNKKSIKIMPKANFLKLP